MYFFGYYILKLFTILDAKKKFEIVNLAENYLPSDCWKAAFCEQLCWAYQWNMHYLENIAH